MLLTKMYFFLHLTILIVFLIKVGSWDHGKLIQQQRKYKLHVVSLYLVAMRLMLML